jgi:hypothetical protein
LNRKHEKKKNIQLCITGGVTTKVLSHQSNGLSFHFYKIVVKKAVASYRNKLLQKMKITTAVICVVTLGVLVTAELWNRDNNPANFEKDYEYNLNTLPASGSLNVMPWTDSYWPSYLGGIAYRWHSQGNKTDRSFNYHLHTKDEVAKMTPAERATLSPAEKFDIYHGRYDYPTVQSEWKRVNPKCAEWEGLCHGWAAAAAHYTQPKPVNITTSEGIVIPFGSADVKGLLTYFVALFVPVTRDNYKVVGDRCNYDILGQHKQYLNYSACIDTNAGAFHVAVTNEVGLRKKTFVIDRDRSYEVWNQPVAHYNYTVLSEAPYTGNDTSIKKLVRVAMSLFYTSELEGMWYDIPAYLERLDMDYNLEINNENKIIGGTYNTYDRTDFLWSHSVIDFFGYFAELSKIYSASVGEPEKPVLDYGLDSFYASPFYSMSVIPLRTRDGHFKLWSYAKGETKAWEISPEGATKIGIKFNKFKTSRIWDTVKVYEGHNGPLVAVLHGDETPQDVIVKASSAYVVFTSTTTVQDGGFDATYYS